MTYTDNIKYVLMAMSYGGRDWSSDWIIKKAFKSTKSKTNSVEEPTSTSGYKEKHSTALEYIEHELNTSKVKKELGIKGKAKIRGIMLAMENILPGSNNAYISYVISTDSNNKHYVLADIIITEGQQGEITFSPMTNDEKREIAELYKSNPEKFNNVTELARRPEGPMKAFKDYYGSKAKNVLKKLNPFD